MATVLERPRISKALPAEKVKGRQSAVAIPKGGYFPEKVEQGRFGPIFPRTPLNYGFTIIAKIIPGREEKFYEYARNIEEEVRVPGRRRVDERHVQLHGVLARARVVPSGS